MVEFKAECQVLKAVWQVHSLQCLVEATSKCQALKVGWQVHSLQCLVEATSGGTPPHVFWKPKKHVGVYISCGQVKYFSEISCLTPPKKIFQGYKGGGMFNSTSINRNPSLLSHIWGPVIVPLNHPMTRCSKLFHPSSGIIWVCHFF